MVPARSARRRPRGGSGCASGCWRGSCAVTGTGSLTSTGARSLTASASPQARQHEQPKPQHRTRGSLNPTHNTNRQADSTQEISGITTRLREAASLPDTLAAAFDAFEVIRRLARGCEATVPALFAPFMTAADAAVAGREPIPIAPPLPPPGPARARVSGPGPGAAVEEIAGALARLGAVLRDRLWHAAAIAATAGDRAAC